jgi:putative heme-binding domain-containing protein
MKLTSLLTLVLLSLGLSNALGQEGFRPLFNGKDLTGWDGNPELWSVEDGCITGKTNGPEHLSYNQFLIWRGGKVKNFELRIKAKVTGNNTGIQYRSRELPGNGKWSVGGYQCDIHPARPNNAMVYEERGRGILIQNGQSVVIDQAGSKWLVAERDMVSAETAEWNEYTVIAQGNHLIHKLNGQVTIDLVDHEEPSMALEGLLAFQIHRGPAMVVQIKDVMLKELPDGGVIPFAQTHIPNDAQKIEKPRPAAKKASAKKGPAKGKNQGKGQAKAQAARDAPAPAQGKPANAADKKAKPRRQAAVGPAIGENKATPVERIKAAKGFNVELLYSVPGGEQGSWVALCNDDKGRIYASDQYGDLYRFSPPAAGQTLKAADVQKVPVNIRAINGMVFAFGALYAGVNDYEQVAQSGLYRISDTDGNDQLDKVELLRAFDSKSDHGVHAVMPTPDGKALYLITGNNAVLDDGPIEGTPSSSPVPKVWGDDHLLPRMPDGRGHNRHVLAPGGIVYRVSPDGKKCEIFASGFRNIYDGSVNSDGELFTYDADMEYDFNTPWYRPTRVNHVVSGGEYGWRNGAGKYPEFYPDNLPATINIGPGSPTGTLFGYGAKFPAKYQRAYYIMDWSWGKLYAVHLAEDGSTYTGIKEDFITGAPLPLTDAIIHPKDGAMYFAIGGRRVQSGLYRVTYTGSEDTSPIDLTPKVSAERALRIQLEAFHGKQDRQAVATAWPHLNSKDRFIRSAARVVIEHQPVAEWEAKVFSETDAGCQLEALLALARVTGVSPSQRPEGASVNTAGRDKMLTALLQLDFSALTPDQKLSHVRLAQIILIRFGNPDQATMDRLIAQLDPAFPSDSFELNWLLCETLVYLQAPNTAAKGMALIAASDSQEPQMEFARSLRMLKVGWTPELRIAQLEWFLKAANYKGGSSFDKFIEFIRDDSLATFTEEEKARHAELIAKKPERKSAIENVGAMLAGRTPTMWTLEELSTAAEKGLKNRDFDNGRKMFGAAACYACHRFGNAGGMNGPDLTGAGGRYSPHDLLDQIINPSKEINEQFAPIVATLNNGEVHIGVVVNLNGDTVTLNTDLTDPNQRVGIDRKEVKSLEVSKVSPMPPMLLAMLKKEEILDLLAYILSGGDKTNAMFKK